MVSERHWLKAIFILYFVLAFGYSLLMPVWEAPDEPAHYHLAWHLAVTKEYALYNYESQQPRLYYYVASLVIGGLNKIDYKLTSYYLPKEYRPNIRVSERRFDWYDGNYRFILGVYILRWINILFGGFAIWLNWKTFESIAPDRPALQFGALAVAGLTPQYLHIMSSVNNDALGTLAGALLFYFMIRFLKEPSSWMGGLLLVLAVLLPLTTKLSVLPVSAVIFLLLAWKWLLGFPQKRWLLYAAVLIGISAGAFYFLFPGAVQFVKDEVLWRLFSLRKNALTLDYLLKVSSQIIWTFWGKVGWLAVGLPYWAVDLLSVLGLIGMGIHARTWVKAGLAKPQNMLWIASWLIAIFTILAVFRNGLTTFATQGRLLFPAMGALSLLMVAGWADVLPELVQRYLPTVIVTLFLSCTIILWMTGVIPVYYQPFLD